MADESDEEKAANGYALLTCLMGIVKQCQERFVGKAEMATEKDPLVRTLCKKLQQVLSYGLKSKSSLSMLKNVHDIVYGNDTFEFWDFCEKHLTATEIHRFSTIKNVSTKRAKMCALIESALNERALSRYFSMWIGDAGITSYFEPWSLLVNAEATNLLPSIASGLATILFAISIGSTYEDNSKALKKEPIIHVPAPTGVPKRVRAIQREILSPDNNEPVAGPSRPSGSNVPDVNHFQNVLSANSSPEINKENVGIERECDTSEVEVIDLNTSSEIGMREIDTSEVESPSTVYYMPNNTFEGSDMESNSSPRVNYMALEVNQIESNPPPGMNFMLLNDPPMENYLPSNPRPQMSEEYNYPSVLINYHTRFTPSPEMNVMDQNAMPDNISLSSSNSGRIDLLNAPANDAEYNSNQHNIPQENNFPDFNPENISLRNYIDTRKGNIKFAVTIPGMNLMQPQRFMKSYYVYTIVVRFIVGPPINVAKRYSEFRALHTALKRTSYDINSLDFPPKNLFGIKSASFYEDRRSRLECYLRSVLTLLPETASCTVKEDMEASFPFLRSDFRK